MQPALSYLPTYLHCVRRGVNLLTPLKTR